MTEHEARELAAAVVELWRFCSSVDQIALRLKIPRRLVREIIDAAKQGNLSTK